MQVENGIPGHNETHLAPYFLLVAVEEDTVECTYHGDADGMFMQSFHCFIHIER